MLVVNVRCMPHFRAGWGGRLGAIFLLFHCRTEFSATSAGK
jgi:hypothetical protein